MKFTHIDLIGLNKYKMLDAPIVRDNIEIHELAKSSHATNRSLSIAGMRHSQGGHTALENGRMVFTEAMEQSIHVDVEMMTVKINAGATWSDLHFKLGPMGLAPLVHQSSPHFSIGGSLSVDCHGREVQEGALSNTVESITVLTNKQGEGFRETHASRAKNPDLFFGALGGYGACGMILDATIRITKNKHMYKFGTRVSNLANLNAYLLTASQGIRNKLDNPPENICMFYVWMNVSHVDEKYLTQCMVYEYIPVKSNSPKMKIKEFKNENWATNEIMRAAWVAGRRNAYLRDKLFDEIQKITTGKMQEDFLINFLREEISFTRTKGDENDVDILQEFFIPLPNINNFLIELKNLLPISNSSVQVLSCTLRVIKPPSKTQTDLNTNNKPFLSYARHDASGLSLDATMISVALEIKVKKEATDNDTIHKGFKVNLIAIKIISSIIEKAHKLNGCYYLPYYQVATPVEFQKAYPMHIEWKAQANIWNPKINGKRAFNNEFLNAYLET